MSVNYLGDIKGDMFTVFRTEFTPRNKSVSGYGSKLLTNYMVRFNNRSYPVCAICWSNCASHYVIISGIKYFLHDYDFPETSEDYHIVSR